MRPIEAMTLVPLGALVVVLRPVPGPDPRARQPAPSTATLERRRAGRAGRPRAVAVGRPDDRPTSPSSPRSSPRSCSRRRSSSSTSSRPAGACPALARHVHRASTLVGAAHRARQPGPAPRARRSAAPTSSTTLTTFLDLLFVVDRRADDRVRARLPRGARPAGRRVRRGPRVRDVGRDAHRRAPADLLVLFLGLELMVLPGYMLAGYHKSDGYSHRGRDQVLPARLVLERDLPVRARVRVGPHRHDAHRGRGGTSCGGSPTAARRWRPALGLGLAFLTTGVAFKIAAVPFHYWTPDAYQGSPTPVTGYLSVGPKIGAFALIIRLFADALGPLAADWNIVIMVLAALTMTLGNLVALTQDNVKRMLAYSSIAHTGYMLVGFAAYGAGESQGLAGPALLRRRVRVHEPRGVRRDRGDPEARLGVTSATCRRSPGLVRREPGARAADDPVPAVSLTGIPPTAGFFGKFYVILAAVRPAAGSTSSPCSRCSTRPSPRSTTCGSSSTCSCATRRPSSRRCAHGRLVWAGLAVATVLTIALGLFPETFLGIVGRAAASVTQIGG